MKKTKQIKIGNVAIGGGAPVSIQSMTNTRTCDVENTILQIRELAAAGCDIVRCAVPDSESANALSEIKKNIDIPLIADIHYDYKLALKAMDNGVDKIRINPGNIGDKNAVREIAEDAKKKGIPIRIGVNSGSLEADILKKYQGVTAEALTESAMRNIELMESLNFSDIVVSVKTSDVIASYDAYKLISEETNHPLHIGITEAGIGERAVIKSAVGIGSLLLQGIGDTIRVSLTGDPLKEVIAARDILSVTGLKKGNIDIISCPTCGRTEVDIDSLANRIKNELRPFEKDRTKRGHPDLTIAVMGCSVNGPGEARNADFGVACGKGKGAIFAKGEILKTVVEEDIAKELIDVIKKNGI